jgi:hypothetical protein
VEEGMSSTATRARISGQRLRGAVAIGLILTTVSGCYSNHSVKTRVSPEFAAVELQKSFDRDSAAAAIQTVRLRDGSEVRFAAPVRPDSSGRLHGAEVISRDQDRMESRPVVIDWSSVSEVTLVEEERRFSWEKTTGLVLGIAGGLLIGLAAAWESAWDCGDCIII